MTNSSISWHNWKKGMLMPVTSRDCYLCSDQLAITGSHDPLLLLTHSLVSCPQDASSDSQRPGRIFLLVTKPNSQDTEQDKRKTSSGFSYMHSNSLSQALGLRANRIPNRDMPLGWAGLGSV